MKKIIQKLKIYFKRLYYSLINKPMPEEKVLTKKELFYKFLKENKDRIKYLMEFNDKDLTNGFQETLISEVKLINQQIEDIEEKLTKEKKSKDLDEINK